MLTLYNTLRHAKENFSPIDRNCVKMFTCGPSIYQPPHIGNYRTFLYEDILVRYLCYCGFTVNRAIILTDIEDKAIEEAKKQGISLFELTERNAQRFLKEAQELAIALPNEIARSSTTISSAIEIIEKLLQKGVAYRHGKNIYFDVHAFPEFGKLYRIDISSWPRRKIRFSRDTYNGRRWNRGDFILWHGNDSNAEISFRAPFGSGRPAWNVQDAAAVVQYLGEQIDINCGGIDNIFRHHDYNIAVMESYTGKQFARYYLHGEHLLVNGKTMSKSRGNIIYPEDIYKKGFKPYHLRFFLLSKHYREKLNFSEKNFLRTIEHLDRVRQLVRAIFELTPKAHTPKASGNAATGIRDVFEEAMNDDLNFPRAFEEVSKMLSAIVRMKSNLSMEELERIRDAINAVDEVMNVLR
ncbi:MAG: class I tRNA ligase family protein [Spirochaetes bacterium]|nr:class I tRNA ligase family protein [Spirochaetota bacterium]